LALLTLTNHIPSFLKGTHFQPIFPVPSPLQKIPSAPNDSDPSHDVVKRKPQETPQGKAEKSWFGYSSFNSLIQKVFIEKAYV